MKRLIPLCLGLFFAILMLSPVLTYADADQDGSGDDDTAASYQSVKQDLTACNELQSNASYISGNFYAELRLGRTEVDQIQMKLTNVETQLDYHLKFNRKSQYTYYQLPPGHYDISAVEFHYFLRKVTKRWIFFKTNVETTIYNYNINPAILRRFELKPGECLYLGDYTMSFVGGIFKTGKLSLKSSYNDQKADFQSKNSTAQLTSRSLAITEIPLPAPPAEWNTADENSAIACRLLANRGSFDLCLYDMTRKNSYRLRFSRNNPFQYLKVAPGEYCITTIYFNGSMQYDAMSYFKLVPKELFWPFTVNAHEVLYLGRMDLELQGKEIGFSYSSDIADDQPQIAKEYRPDRYHIRAVNEQ